MKLSQYRKGVAAVSSALGVIVSSGLLHGTAEVVVNTCIAVIGAVSVIYFPNEPLTK